MDSCDGSSHESYGDKPDDISGGRKAGHAVCFPD